MPDIVQVAIVGGGIAGLKAAHTLLKSANTPFKPEDVVVLEAQDRVGGRILTDRNQSKLGQAYDLGAAWFHDSLTNPVLLEAIAADEKEVFDVAKDTYFDDEDPQFYVSELDGPLDVHKRKLDRVLDELEKFVELHYMYEPGASDVSLRQIVAKYFELYPRHLTHRDKDLVTRMSAYLESWYGFSSDRISAKYMVMDHQGRNLLNTKGYDFVTTKLAKDIESSIRLGFAVETIDTESPRQGKIAVSGPSGTIYCNHLIVTVPYSILSLPSSHPYGITWTPPLPAKMIAAFDTVHFAALGKVVFEFEQVWWDPEPDTFQILPDAAAAPAAAAPAAAAAAAPAAAAATALATAPATDKLESLPAPFSYYAHVLNFAKHSKVAKGGSLVILTQSPLTEYLESHKDDAWTYFKPMLAKLAVSPITDPINVITSEWTQNPYIRGSYTGIEVGDDPVDIIVQLSGDHETEGIPERNVRFAGEHTISDGAGCVHGAYQSGLREANYILDKVTR